MFLIFINDLPDNIVSLIKLFVDDAKLFARIRTLQDCNRLQADLTRLQGWTRQWLLLFNASKCKVLRIGHNPPAATYTMDTIDGQSRELEESACERDLGVLIDNKLKFSQKLMQWRPKLTDYSVSSDARLHTSTTTVWSFLQISGSSTSRVC